MCVYHKQALPITASHIQVEIVINLISTSILYIEKYVYRMPNLNAPRGTDLNAGNTLNTFESQMSVDFGSYQLSDESSARFLL